MATHIFRISPEGLTFLSFYSFTLSSLHFSTSIERLNVKAFWTVRSQLTIRYHDYFRNSLLHLCDETILFPIKTLSKIPYGSSRGQKSQEWVVRAAKKSQVSSRLVHVSHLEPNDGQLPGRGSWGNFGRVCYMAPPGSYSWTRRLNSPLAKTNEWTENDSNGDWIKLGEREKKVIQSTENSQEFCLNGSGLE